MAIRACFGMARSYPVPRVLTLLLHLPKLPVSYGRTVKVYGVLVLLPPQVSTPRRRLLLVRSHAVAIMTLNGHFLTPGVC